MPKQQGLPNYSLADCQRDAYAAAAQVGLPGSFLFNLAIEESGCGKRIYGADGEIGVTQILPGTFAQYGCSGTLLNPIDDFKCSATILSKLYSRYGSYSLDLAAYNAGPGNLTRCADGSYSVPRSSTVTYVMDILTRAGIPIDKVVKRGCSGSAPAPGGPAPAPAPGGQPTGGNMGGISGNIELPGVRSLLVYGLALVLLIFAVTKLKR